MDLLRHLTFFAAVADARHFGHAADDLGMTQPPVSQGIQRLEQRLGARLFERSSRGVELTAAGTALLPAARGVLEAAERFSESAHRLERARSVLTLGLAGGLGRVGIDLAAGAAAATDRTVRLLVAGSNELVAGVAAHRVDVAVVRHPLVIDGTLPGDVHRVRTRLLTPLGVDLDEFTRSDLPLALEPRRHHPAAHDQLVDALRRLGHSGETVAAEEPEAMALVAARSAAALIAGAAADDAVRGARSHAVPGLAIRLRTVVPSLRDPGSDAGGVAAALDTVLEGHGDAA